MGTVRAGAAMTQTAPDTEHTVPGAPADETIAELFGRLIEDSEHYVRAEIALGRARAIDRLARLRGALLLLVCAVALLMAALVALLVGLIATLREPLGPALATLVVVGGSIALSGLLGWIGVWLVQHATRLDDAP